MDHSKILTKRPLSLYFLMACLLFLSLGGFYGGLMFTTDPSGHSMGMAVDALKPLQLNSYLMPGLFLIVVYGIGPLAVMVALWTRWQWAGYALIGLNLVLLGWLAGEVILLNLIAPISIVLAVLAVIMLVLAAFPTTRHYYTTGA